MGLFGLSLKYGDGRLTIYKDQKRAGHTRRRPFAGVRQFAAGQAGGNLVASWTTTPFTADYIVKTQLRNLRARSRELECTDPHARRFLGLVKNNVAGPRGMRLQMRIVDPGGRSDDLANDAIEAAWRDWGRPEICDIEGRRSWVDVQRLFIGTVARDGEFLARVITGGMNDYGLALQILDPDLLDINYNKDLGDGRYIRFGIEFDKWSRPVAYHLIDINPAQEITSYPSYANRYVRVPADKVIHSFVPEWPGQKRGLPWMSTAMLNMKQRAGYMESAVVAARLGASKVGTIESPTGEGWTGDAVSTDGGEGDTGGVEYMDAANPGEWIKLPEGWKIGGWNPEYPRGEFSEFVKRCLQSEASGLETDYCTYSGDLEGVNYSSARVGILETREYWKGRQDWMISNFCRPVYEKWLEMALWRGALTVMGKPLKISREAKYRQVVWQPRRWPWVDPEKDMKANVLALENNLTTHSAIISENGDGDDAEDVWRQAEKDKQMQEKYGLSVSKQEVQPNGQGQEDPAAGGQDEPPGDESESE